MSIISCAGVDVFLRFPDIGRPIIPGVSVRVVVCSPISVYTQKPRRLKRRLKHAKRLRMRLFTGFPQ